MEDILTILEKLQKQGKVRNAFLDKINILLRKQHFYIIHLACGEIIQDDDLVVTSG
jgi:hypothetical protein